MPQNKFEVLLSRIMQCGKGEKIIRKQEIVVMEYFKYRGAQVQGILQVKEKKRNKKEKSNMCGNATKGTAKRAKEN